MRNNVSRWVWAGAICGGALTSAGLLKGTDSRAAQPQAIPPGMVLADEQTLRKMVHDEVAAQLHELMERSRPTGTAARVNALQSTLSIIRSQLALYRLQHNDLCPTLAQLQDNWRVMRTRTRADGTADEDNGYGPYFQSVPVNVLTGKSHVAAAGSATADDGWSYDPKTGLMRAVLPSQSKPYVRGILRTADVEFVNAQ